MKKRISKELILGKSIKFIQIYGVDKLSARTLAKFMNCSTQPIYSYFENFDEVINKSLDLTYNFMQEKYLTNNYSDEIFLNIGLGYIDFVIKEKTLFYFLYLSKYSKYNFTSNDSKLNDFYNIACKDKNVQKYDKEVFLNIYNEISIYTQGLAIILYNKPNSFTFDEVKEKLKIAATSFSEFYTKEGKL